MRRKRWMFLIALLLAVVIGDGLLWHFAVQQMRDGLAGWIAAMRANGWSVSATTPEAGGWPLEATLTVGDVALQGGASDIPGGLTWRAERVVLRLHPKLAPIKVAVLPLIKKEGMPEAALAIYRDLKDAGIASYFDQQAAIGRRYRRQDEIGTPFCLTIDGETAKDNTVTIRDRDTLAQERLPIKNIVDEIQRRLRK